MGALEGELRTAAALDGAIPRPWPRPRGDHYRPSIDGLRAVAIASVLLFHLNRSWLPGGFVGVDIFFTISGYLITSILQRSDGRRPLSLSGFYQRRIARLLPAFAICAVVTIAVARVIYSQQDFASTAASMAAAAAYVANLKFLTQGNYFVLSPDAQPFLHCWSLSVEEQFYLLFPLSFLLLMTRARRYAFPVVALICLVSLATSVVVTAHNPTWAFFLLPTRAWEFLAGSLVAMRSGADLMKPERSGARRWLVGGGLLLVALSVLLIHDTPRFPGYRAALPVLGTLGIVAGSDQKGGPNALLSWRPVVLMGRASYSLYLWHWPIFSFVDYALYLSPPAIRLVWKLVPTALATTATFLLVESPARAFLNRPGRRTPAFVLLATTLVVLVPSGIALRRANYIDVEASEVSRGGHIYNPRALGGSILLMGDSHASMYGTTLRGLSEELGARLQVVSVPAGDPLPGLSERSSPALWQDTLRIVQTRRPDVVVLVCRWRSKLAIDPERVARAVSTLRQYVPHVVLLTQPPELPEDATRSRMRDGSRPPFYENPAARAERVRANAVVEALGAEAGVTVVDVARDFSESDGSIRLKDSRGRDLYQDADHLTTRGTAVAARALKDAIQAALR